MFPCTTPFALSAIHHPRGWPRGGKVVWCFLSSNAFGNALRGLLI
ncbi:hypothetical protein Rleg_5782 (plasmid) [Rhizobium leguminosarum bv. trifolii WSM1325]|uniref:Uncharacterized protein n=1 Tax=Rhizobium leguminosarum bv. trifolii (strain WSM1325) TaxID=395491 RepID=C6B840_RHILS|nr:hypothetical protein Rleg_5782 [Rhizobium leguminosarum bv. trifolii WSM1325]